MASKILVTAAGLALVVFVNWYFLFFRRKPGRAKAPRTEA
jgi:plastocyanin domain-containing protein